MLELLSASPLVALGLAGGGLVLVLLVVRALRRRRPEAPAARATPRSASRERRSPRTHETATADDSGASARSTAPPAPAARPVAATAPAVEPPPAVERASDTVARGHGATAADEPTQAPSVEPPGVAELPPLPFDDAAAPPVERPAPAWLDAIPTPEVVEVAAHDAEPESEPAATPDVVAFALPDAEPPAAPRMANDVPAEAIGEVPAADAFPPFELSIDDAAWPPADASPAEAASPVAEPAPDEPLPAFALAEPVVDDVAEPPSLPPPPPADAGPARLLVVDDSAVVRAKLRKVLEGGGHKVDVAKDGREALALLAAGRYALMVTDLEMPTMSGFELIAAVRASAGLAALPIVAITGHDDLEPYRQRLPGLAGLFRKPWVDGDLLAHLAGVLAEARSAPGSAAAPSPEPRPMALA